MVTIYDALVDPTRRQMLDLIRERPRLVGELVDLLAISQPLASKHLRVLREAGVVRVRQDAQRRWYELRPEPLAEMDAWLAPYREHWEARYGRLDDLLAQMQAERTQRNEESEKSEESEENQESDEENHEE